MCLVEYMSPGTPAVLLPALLLHVAMLAAHLLQRHLSQCWYALPGVFIDQSHAVIVMYASACITAPLQAAVQLAKGVCPTLAGLRSIIMVISQTCPVICTVLLPSEWHSLCICMSCW
jgi:hypothetical protein